MFMAKKIFKRSLALGALMAFVITGNAMAAVFDSIYEVNNAINNGNIDVTINQENLERHIYLPESDNLKIEANLNVVADYSKSDDYEQTSATVLGMVNRKNISLYGNIDYNIVQVHDDNKSGYYIYGIFAKNTTFKQFGNVSFSAANVDDKIFAIKPFSVMGNSDATLYGDINVTLRNIASERIQPIVVSGGATINHIGDVNFYAENIDDRNKTTDSITGYWVTGDDNTGTEPNKSYHQGDVNMTFIGEKDSSKYSDGNFLIKNVYGVAVRDAILEHKGNTIISFGGETKNLFSNDNIQTIFGNLHINAGEYIQNGLTKLDFGSFKDDGTLVKFKSDVNNPMKWSFANFDVVTIVEGSELYIDGTQAKSVMLEDDNGYADFVIQDTINNVEDSSLISCYGGNLNLRGNTLTIEDKASATMQNLNSENGATVTIGNDAKLTVKEHLGNGAVNFVVSSLAKDQVKVGTAEVIHTAETSSDNLGKDLEKGLANLRMVATDKDNNSIIKKVVGTEGAVYDHITAEFDNEGNIVDINKTIAAANYSIGEMYSVALMAWRAENNDMHKRLGELRDANGEHGVWARMTRGESEYKSVKNQYNTYQLGYDQKTDDWTVGAAVSYTEGETSFAKGNGENDHTGLAVYGSKLNKDGSYIDLIAKYANLDHEYTARGGIGSGEYDTDGFALSAEYGKRFEQGNGLWIEPQVELTYGLVDSVDFEAENGRVSLDNMNSLVGRVGFRAGKDIKDGNVYARASYLYDFEGETDITFNDMETITQDLGGGWWEVGVGANINLSKATYIYADVEKTFDGEVDTDWKWNLGVRYSF